MTRQQVLDLYFLDARGKLIEIAAFLDRSFTAGERRRFEGVTVWHLPAGPPADGGGTTQHEDPPAHATP